MTRLLARGLSAVLIALLVIVCALLAWLVHPQSLGLTLQALPTLMPATSGLRVEKVEGSLLKGGVIGRLHWQADGLEVDIQDLQLAYDLRDLLQRRLRVNTAHARQVHINDQSPSHPDRTPPASLQLPLSLHISAQVEQLYLQGGRQPTITGAQLDYSFDGQTHRLEQGQFALASGHYQVHAQMDAQAPMHLHAEIAGELRAPAPGKKTGQALRASATLQGEIGNPDQPLQVQAQVQPQTETAPSASASTKLHLLARLQPWKAQALASAEARWQQLDLSRFWPGSPPALLSGQLRVQPQGPSWEAQLELNNQLNGPIDQQRLPLQSLKARLRYQDQAWVVQTLQANTGAGLVSGQGRWVNGHWQLEAQLKQLAPESVDTRWQGGPISGTVRAQQQGKLIRFETDVQASPWRGTATTEAWPVQLQNLKAKGQWSGTELQVEALQLHTMQATAQGKGRYNPAKQDVELDLTVQAPGLQSSIQGALAAQQGQGRLQVHIDDVRRSSQWLRQWPVLQQQLSAANWQGRTSLQGSWQGGWKDYRTGLQLDLTVQTPDLQWRTAGNSPGWSVRDASARISGTPAALQLQSDGRLEHGTQQLQWRTQAASQLELSKAQVTLQDLRLDWKASPSARAWTAQLKPAASARAGGVQLQWQLSDDTQRVDVAGGSITITGPLAGKSTLQWTPGQWTRQGHQPAQWRTEGSFKDLPASWMDAFSPQPMSELGLSSDLLLQGLWQMRQNEQLSVHARIERASGDLRLNTGDQQQAVLPAELREASLVLDLNEQALAAHLRWDSSRAGKALVAFSTMLNRSDQAWIWPDTAPVAASIQLQSPPAQAWTALTPPGWRLKGMVDANLTLAGTRSEPVWAGELRARELALRSLVHGLDFDRGTLQATLRGQELTINHARLEGAGVTGGTLDVRGTMAWITDSRLPKILDHVQAKLSAQLQSFRVSVRPDRRLSASGNIQASLAGSQWNLDGSLKADHALITLPNDNAPTLGEDVVIRSISNSQPANLIKASAPPTPSPMAFKLKVTLDPGEDFQIRGRGLQGRLSGQLLLQSTGPGTTQLTGTLRTEDGTYQAYGQRLNIEQGRLLFGGSVDNPTLDILAIRPQITQRVGVQISGTALAPVVRLYADPDLPDVEKLSWLLTGRAASAGGAEAALLQQAAMTLISGRNNGSSKTLAQSFGLDVLSLQSKSTTNANASNAASDANAASITLGKRLSRDVYVAYEHSLSGAVNAFSIFYELSQRFTLRAQTGEQTALDLIFTLRYD